MGQKLQKIYLTYYNLLIVQDFWEAHYQILSVIFLKEFIKLNISTDSDKNVKHAELNAKIVTVFLNTEILKDDLIEYKCLYCNKNYQQKFDEKLKEQFFNACKFSDHNNNKFILSLQKGVYPYEYMDDWENFNETLPDKEDFYSH